MKTNKGFATILVIIVGLLVIGIGVSSYLHFNQEQPSEINKDNAVDSIPTEVTPEESAELENQDTTTKDISVKNCIPVEEIDPLEIDLNNSPIGLTIKEEYKYFEVYGVNKTQVLEQILNCGPLSGEELVPRYAGEAFWIINYSYDYIQEDNLCNISNAKVGIRLKYYLPSLDTSLIADEDLKRDWDSFINILLDHEKTHGQIAIETAESVLKYLNDSDIKDCQDVNSGANKILEEGNNMQVEFDEETVHGLKQFKHLFLDEIKEYFPWYVNLLI